MISEYYPDSMTLDEYNNMFGDRGIDWEDSKCQHCMWGQEHRDGCLCGDTLLSRDEIPSEDEKCEDFEER